MNISARIKNDSVIWNDSLRVRVGKPVIYEGNYYSNITGINSVPGTSNDWVFVGSTKSTVTGLHKNPSNDPDNNFLEEGDIIKRVVEGAVIEGIYNGPNPNLQSSYTIYTTIEF